MPDVPGGLYWTDGWDGYPAARARLLGAAVERKAGNVVVLGGDVHANYVADLKLDFDDAKSPVVATEFCGTSITSEGMAQSRIDAALPFNPHIRYGRADQHGYTRFTLDAKTLQAQLRVVDDVLDPASAIRTAAGFVVEAGTPGRATGLSGARPLRYSGPMQAILGVTAPFFALVLCGYLAARSRVLPQSAIPGLNAFVLFFALPCMLFRFGASTPFAQLVDPALLGLYAACALAMVAFTLALTLRRAPDGPGVDLKNAAFGALVAAFPNTGFMGVPLLVALLGERAAGPVIGTILVDLFVTSSLCIALAQMHTQRGGDADAAAAFRSRQPCGARSAARWRIRCRGRSASARCSRWPAGHLPGALGQIVRMLGDAATPVALFTIGAVLWRAGQHAHTRTPPAQFVPVALFKLFVHPLLVFGAGLLAHAAGAPVSSFGLTVLVLAAALPSASNVSLLAERYGADNGRVARIIMTSTVLAFVSFTALAWTLGARPPTLAR